MTEEDRFSVHGGSLDVGDQVLRSEVAEQLFGRKSSVNIGRFVVDGKLGVGGMGQVFAATDPELGRKVAVKIVRLATSLDPAEARSRLEREARAQAKLTHPNVVTLYEVGQHDDGLYLAMQLVEGTTLRVWFSDETRPWIDIVDKFVQAGEGLAAAHRQGLVHRDFKPDNVLIAEEDGRALVADFGLVGRPGGQLEAEPTEHDAVSAGAGSDSPPATMANVGTPGYMAPEQVAAIGADARSDQFAYCASLYEAVTGKLPNSEGVPTWAGVPGPLVPILERGLQHDPADRFADMATLLLALRRAARPKKRWPYVLGGMAGLVGLAAVVSALQGPQVCEREVEAKALYAGATREAVLAAMSGQPVGRESLDERLHVYAGALANASRSTCQLAASSAHEDVTRRHDCLDIAAGEAKGLIAGLTGGVAGHSRYAVHWAEALPEPELCNTPRHLEGWPEHATEASRRQQAEAWAALSSARSALARRAEVERLERRTEQARGEAAQVLDTATQIGDRALAARARQLLGQAAIASGDSAAAEEHLLAAADLAEAIGDHATAGRALTLTVFATGRDPDRVAEARQLAARAASILEAVGDPPVLRGQLASNLGVALANGIPADPDGGIVQHRAAIELLTGALGPRHSDVLKARVNLSNALARAGGTAEALAELEGVAEQAADVWGPRSPAAASLGGAMGMALLRVGRTEDAVRALRAALAAKIDIYGEAHDSVSDARYNLGIALRRSGANDEALQYLRAGFTQRNAQREFDGGAMIPWHFAIGTAELARGRTEEAAVEFEAALAVCERDGAPPFDFARIRFGLARSIAAHDGVRARILAEAALKVFDADPKMAKRANKVRSFLLGL